MPGNPFAGVIAPGSPPSPADFEVVQTGNGAVTRKKRKAFSENSTDTVQTIFGLKDPHMINTLKVEQFLAHHPHLVPREPYPMANPKCLVGVEVELENLLKIDPNVLLLFWDNKPDNSLRNNGMEFVTRGVLATGYIEMALNQLFGGINEDVDFSNRTSIHVHMDIRQLTLQQMVGLVMTYTAVENLLFKYSGLNRRSNIFCVPLTETGLFELMADDPKKFMHAVDQHWSKYTAMNLLPVVSQGSVEFRHLPGTKNIRQILGWIDLLTRLKVFVYKHELGSIIDSISELNGSSRYQQFVESVFGEASIYLDKSNLLSDMERPVWLVKNAGVSNKFNQMVLKNPTPDSQLNDLLNSWARGLTKQQLVALHQLCKLWKHPNPETVFRDIVSRPNLYLTAHPQHTSLINLVLKTNQEALKPKKGPYPNPNQWLMSTISNNDGDSNF